MDRGSTQQTEGRVIRAFPMEDSRTRRLEVYARLLGEHVDVTGAGRLTTVLSKSAVLDSAVDTGTTQEFYLHKDQDKEEYVCVYVCVCVCVCIVCIFIVCSVLRMAHYLQRPWRTI